jgi:hypothetical protein
VISYNDSEDTYLIEHISDNAKRHAVRSTDVIGKLPDGYFRNESQTRDFGTGSLVWYHQGYDEFPGTVIRCRDNADSTFTYAITYTYENGQASEIDASRGSVSHRE